MAQSGSRVVAPDRVGGRTVWHDQGMAAGDESTPDRPDPSKVALDPDALKQAHGRTGNYLQKAGLPFEEDEFDESQSLREQEKAAADSEEE